MWLMESSLGCLQGMASGTNDLGLSSLPASPHHLGTQVLVWHSRLGSPGFCSRARPGSHRFFCVILG